MAEEGLIAYCGLNCADCHGYKGRVPDLARDLRKELRSSRYEKFADFMSNYSFARDFANHEECYKVLGAMVKFRCKRACREGEDHPSVKLGSVLRTRISMVVGSAMNFQIARSWTSLNPFMEMRIVRTLGRYRKKE